MTEREWALKCLQIANSPESVRNRGCFRCHSVVSENSCTIASLFNDEINKIPFCNYGYVGGLENGAILIAQGLHEYIIDADHDSCYSSFYVRKQEKCGKFIECGFDFGAAPCEETPVIIVDDVLNTGYSIARASKAVEKEWGYKPKLAVVLVDTEVGGKEFLKTKGIECRSIFTAKEILG